MSEQCEQLCSLCSTNEQDEQLVFSLYIEIGIRLSYELRSTYFKSLLDFQDKKDNEIVNKTNFVKLEIRLTKAYV